MKHLKSKPESLILIIGFLVLAVSSFTCFGQVSSWDPVASFKDNTLLLDNGIIRREINISRAGRFTTDSYWLRAENEEFIESGTSGMHASADKFTSTSSDEFGFTIDGQEMTGFSGWEYVSHEPVENGIKLNIKSKEIDLQLGITYLIYPGLPLIRKNIEFTNTGDSEFRLESLDIERIKFAAGGIGTNSWVMNDYGRQKHLGQFTGNWYDPVVVIHHTVSRRGIFLGNEAPGVMKRTTAFLTPSLLTVGLTHIDQNFGFRQWIQPGETWESTWVFSGVYVNSDDPSSILNTAVNDFVRNHMDCRIFQVEEMPVFVYNTWSPFKHNINEEMICELADAAAECGIEEFIIDDGWQESFGDWGVHKEKFPNGLKPVFDYIKSKGMKPGVWISLAAAETKSNVYKEHPQWLVRKKDGSPINLHSDKDILYDWESHSMCMTTGWLKDMQGKHDFMTYRQDLPGFGEPQDGFWDGFQRINTETRSGGIIGVFKQNSYVNEMWITIDYLEPGWKYEVRQAPDGRVVAQGTGEKLRTSGFEVVFKDHFQGELYEIRRYL